MKQSEINKIMADYDIVMAEFESNEPPPPKCHFTHMEMQHSDYETWWECKYCGHTILIEVENGER